MNFNVDHPKTPPARIKLREENNVFVFQETVWSALFQRARVPLDETRLLTAAQLGVALSGAGPSIVPLDHSRVGVPFRPLSALLHQRPPADVGTTESAAGKKRGGVSPTTLDSHVGVMFNETTA